jgi:hypothetical protein
MTLPRAVLEMYNPQMKIPHEKLLYPIVERWMKKHLRCFKVASNIGSSHSRPDVVGIRDIGGDLSGEVQTIAVEVKKEGPPFATMSGQTLGYNVYANRIYLAQSREQVFTIDQMDIASHLGIGLVQIRGGKCHEILSSPFYTPITRFNLRLLESLGLGRCQYCSSFFGIGDATNRFSKMIRAEEPAERVLKAINSEKGLMFWNMEVAERKRKLGVTKAGKDESQERRFICPECVQGLLAIDSDRIKSWLSEFSPKRGG